MMRGWESVNRDVSWNQSVHSRTVKLEYDDDINSACIEESATAMDPNAGHSASREELYLPFATRCSYASVYVPNVGFSGVVPVVPVQAQAPQSYGFDADGRRQYPKEQRHDSVFDRVTFSSRARPGPGRIFHLLDAGRLNRPYNRVASPTQFGSEGGRSKAPQGWATLKGARDGGGSYSRGRGSGGRGRGRGPRGGGGGRGGRNGGAAGGRGGSLSHGGGSGERFVRGRKKKGY